MEYLSQPDSLDEALSEAALLRIESSGENFEVEKRLLLLGHEAASSPAESPSESLSPADLFELAFENGRILPMRQWYLGWKAALEDICRRLRQHAGCRVMNAPAEILRMFDKKECHRIFETAGVRTPRLISQPGSFDQLMEDMKAANRRRAFIKPCHASSASGVVAFEFGALGMQAFTTVEKNGPHLFNSLHVRRYRDAREIRSVIDAICRHHCIAEDWLPKAGFQGGRIDLRILVVAGSAGHAVLRHSRGPMTNLHLGNSRADLEAFRRRLGEDAWLQACRLCERAARAFPGAHYAGIDLLVSPSLRNFAVAEINAFGDLLPRLEFDGKSTYQLELHRWTGAPVEKTQVSTSGR